MSRKSKHSAVIVKKEVNLEERPVVTAHKEPDTGRLSPHDLIEKITKNKIVFQNYKYPGADEAFKGMPSMMTCERFYPLAEGGPLFVDEPQFSSDWKDCEKKKEVMAKHGSRYLIMGRKPDGSFVDVIDAMEQLGIK